MIRTEEDGTETECSAPTGDETRHSSSDDEALSPSSSLRPRLLGYANEIALLEPRLSTDMRAYLDAEMRRLFFEAEAAAAGTLIPPDPESAGERSRKRVKRSNTPVPVEALRLLAGSGYLEAKDLGVLLLRVSKAFKDMLGVEEIWRSLCRSKWGRGVSDLALTSDVGTKGFEWLFRKLVLFDGVQRYREKVGGSCRYRSISIQGSQYYNSPFYPTLFSALKTAMKTKLFREQGEAYARLPDNVKAFLAKARDTRKEMAFHYNVIALAGYGLTKGNICVPSTFVLQPGTAESDKVKHNIGVVLKQIGLENLPYHMKKDLARPRHWAARLDGIWMERLIRMCLKKGNLGKVVDNLRAERKRGTWSNSVEREANPNSLFQAYYDILEQMNFVWIVGNVA